MQWLFYAASLSPEWQVTEWNVHVHHCGTTTDERAQRQIIRQRVAIVCQMLLGRVVSHLHLNLLFHLAHGCGSAVKQQSQLVLVAVLDSQHQALSLHTIEEFTSLMHRVHWSNSTTGSTGTLQTIARHRGIHLHKAMSCTARQAATRAPCRRCYSPASLLCSNLLWSTR